MAQLTIDTLNKTDRENTMVALQAIASSNGEELLFCPITELNEQIGKFEKLNSDYQKCKEEKDLFEEELNKEIEKSKSLFEANNNLREKMEEFEKSNKELTAVVKELREKLSVFTIGYGADGTSELLYFKPEDNELIRTTQNNAFYIGASKGDCFEFLFNDEKASHQRAIQSKETLLMPFCEIEASATDANYVENRDKGKFSIINGEFKLNDKVKVRLVKK